MVSVCDQTAVSFFIGILGDAIGFEEALLQNADVGLVGETLHFKFKDHKLKELVDVLYVGLGGLSDHLIVLINRQD